MVIKVSRNNIRIRIVRRVLNRAKFMYIIFKRYNDNSAGVLSRRTFYTLTAFCKSFHLRITHHKISLLAILLYITECGFFRDSTDCSGFKNLTLAEECFGVFMDYRLIHARKVKVNIRLFIALKSKECFKRNIVAVFSVLRSAFRTHLIGQVTPRQTDFRLNKLYVFTIRANIVTLK